MHGESQGIGFGFIFGRMKVLDEIGVRREKEMWGSFENLKSPIMR